MFPERRENENIEEDEEGKKRFKDEVLRPAPSIFNNSMILTGGAAAVGTGIAWVWF